MPREYSGIIISRVTYLRATCRRCPLVEARPGPPRLVRDQVTAYTRPAPGPRAGATASARVIRLSLPKDLAGLRAEIDRIDDRIADLLVERLEVVRAIGHAKGDLAARRLALRLGREAQMMRRLLARTAGGFPPGGVLRIWREIIANSTQIEVPFGCVVDRRGGVRLHDLARDQVGSATPISPADGAAALMARLDDELPRLGVLIPPGPEDWWPALLPEGVRIVARLPLSAAEPLPQGYVVARLEPEPSGDDLTVIETDAGRLPELARELAADGTGRRLVELPGFATTMDGARRVGGYPRPLRLPDGPLAGEQA